MQNNQNTSPSTCSFDMIAELASAAAKIEATLIAEVLRNQNERLSRPCCPAPPAAACNVSKLFKKHVSRKRTDRAFLVKEVAKEETTKKRKV